MESATLIERYVALARIEIVIAGRPVGRIANRDGRSRAVVQHPLAVFHQEFGWIGIVEHPVGTDEAAGREGRSIHIGARYIDVLHRVELAAGRAVAGGNTHASRLPGDPKSVVEGKSGSVRVALGGSRINKKK